MRRSNLRTGIKARKIGGGWEVVSMAEYSPYVEWGTRRRVNVPADLQAFAAQFRGTGQPGNAKELIYAWCKRQGIPDEELAKIYDELYQRIRVEFITDIEKAIGKPFDPDDLLNKTIDE